MSRWEGWNRTLGVFPLKMSPVLIVLRRCFVMPLIAQDSEVQLLLCVIVIELN